jgi:transmembrane sensor
VAAMAVVFREPLELSLVPKTVYETRPGQLQTIALSDGSQVFLNGGTRLEVRIAKHFRSAHLYAGEAFFDIRHDSKRPFNIELAQGRVEDLGTQFDLSYIADTVEVSVYQGRVRLNGRKAYGDLAPGQRGQLTSGNIAMLSGFDPSGGDWRQGWIEPQDWPLERVTEALSRHSGLPIIIKKAELRHKRIAGRLRLDDPQQQLATLAMIHGFHVEKQGAALIIQ